MKKITAIVAGGVGYVLGARAGRGRYEQIRGLAQRVSSNPRVQQGAQQAADLAKDKVSGAAEAATQKVKSSSGPSNGVPLEDSAYPKD